MAEFIPSVAERSRGTLRILAVAGSLREGSYNKKLVAQATHRAQALGATIDLVDLKALALPSYDADVDAVARPAAATQLRERVGQAQGVLISTPEYNHSIPGGLKNAIDWASRPQAGQPFNHKPALILGATSGIGGTMFSRNHLREVLVALGCWTLPGSLAVSKAEDAFDERGQLKDEKARGQLDKLVALLVEAVRHGVPKV